MVQEYIQHGVITSNVCSFLFLWLLLFMLFIDAATAAATAVSTLQRRGGGQSKSYRMENIKLQKVKSNPLTCKSSLSFRFPATVWWPMVSAIILNLSAAAATASNPSSRCSVARGLMATAPRPKDAPSSTPPPLPPKRHSAAAAGALTTLPCFPSASRPPVVTYRIVPHRIVSYRIGGKRKNVIFDVCPGTSIEKRRKQER